MTKGLNNIKTIYAMLRIHNFQQLSSRLFSHKLIINTIFIIN